MDWITILAVIIGGLATLGGGWFQSYQSQKGASKQKILDEKVMILRKLMSVRVALQNDQSSQVFGPEFVAVINSIDIAFRDNNGVLTKYRAFKNHVNSQHARSERIMVLLHELVSEMYKDLGMEPLDIDDFKSVVSLRSMFP